MTSEISALGFGIATVSVDTDRALVEAWGLLNPKERGGVAYPATVVLAPDATITWIEYEGMARRIRPAEMLAWLRVPSPGSHPPSPRPFWPRIQDWWRAITSPRGR
ncbi:MAG TPA: hypothetical protein VN690_11905 [Terriglobales bacterium]|nr:hypothetical protein [Terriglobales bacterium]